MLSELALSRFDEMAEKYRCELRQQMSRSNNGLVSLFSRLSVVILYSVVFALFSFYMYRPSCYGLWLFDINKDRLTDWLMIYSDWVNDRQIASAFTVDTADQLRVDRGRTQWKDAVPLLLACSSARFVPSPGACRLGSCVRVDLRVDDRRRGQLRRERHRRIWEACSQVRYVGRPQCNELNRIKAEKCWGGGDRGDRSQLHISNSEDKDINQLP